MLLYFSCLKISYSLLRMASNIESAGRKNEKDREYIYTLQDVRPGLRA